MWYNISVRGREVRLFSQGRSQATADTNKQVGHGSRCSYQRGLWRRGQSLLEPSPSTRAIEGIVGIVLASSVEPPSHEHMSHPLRAKVFFLILFLRTVRGVSSSTDLDVKRLNQ